MSYWTRWADKLVNTLIYSFLLLFALITVVPFIHVIAGSFASVESLLSNKFLLFPTDVTLDAYRYIFSTNILFRSLLVSIGITIVGTTLSMLLTITLGYSLSRRDLDGRKLFMMLIVFTIMFQGGMIPTFLIVRALGLIDTYWALMLPGAISAFNLIIMRSFFMQLPEGLEESAKIDGCNDFGILFRIVMPLSMPAIATISLFYAVGYWNMFMQAILYLNDASKWPVQVLLRQIVVMASGMQADMTDLPNDFVPPEQSVKMAVIVVATVPVLLVYPFLQKHFTKGALLGSVKG